MSWDRNNLAPHALPSILCDSLSFSSAGLNLGCHLGQLGMLPMVTGNGLNTSLQSVASAKKKKCTTIFQKLSFLIIFKELSNGLHL